MIAAVITLLAPLHLFVGGFPLRGANYRLRGNRRWTDRAIFKK